jgi:hypothetical protein
MELATRWRDRNRLDVRQQRDLEVYISRMCRDWLIVIGHLPIAEALAA